MRVVQSVLSRCDIADAMGRARRGVSIIGGQAIRTPQYPPRA